MRRTRKGVIDRLAEKDGFGFIQASDGHEVCFVRDSVAGGGFDRLKIGQEVWFVEGEGKTNPRAERVRPVEPRRRPAGRKRAAGRAP